MGGIGQDHTLDLSPFSNCEEIPMDRIHRLVDTLHNNR